jgi:hypothetical protein
VSGYQPPQLLQPADDLDGFTCRSSEQTTWLRRHARQSAATGTTRVFVVTPHARCDVVAYYAWCMAQIDIQLTPSRLRKGAGRYPALLARLGVHIDHEGRGLGAGLLADAVTRLVGISEDIGYRGLLIHAETGAARDFYRHLIPELAPSPTDELHLVLLMKDARQTLLGIRALAPGR